ncbi:MAG: CofH family radical SAM protein [Bacteroidales bacterium]|jgi:cyclic dehypoxanthinyl futalosine synthase|nr:CofH family radical SAM protein [Bacteroidales bacterium]
MELTSTLLNDILNGYNATAEEYLDIYENENTATLLFAGHFVKSKIHKHNKVGWMIDRNINITNVCISGCQFCNFHCSKNSKNAYITSIDEYRQKIDELFQLGGNQILLQGGMHQDLGLDFYKNLFKTLKIEYPNLLIHALGPPEVAYISKKEGISFSRCLKELTEAGMDSLPGAGAEILDNEIRKEISKNKCSADEWLQVMIEAHKQNIPTSATMMFGHVENNLHRIQHLMKLQKVQEQKPKENYGFITFIPWAAQLSGTSLGRKFKNLPKITSTEYLRLIAISRLILRDIPNIQTSFLTVGKATAQLSLFAGANDLGSIMIEENVLSSVGSGYRTNADELQNIISETSFIPARRNQLYEFI